MWQLKKFNHELAAELAASLNQPLVLGQFLAARGFKDADSVRLFLSPELKNLPSPMSLPNMEKAIRRLLVALKNGEKVCVCGDYDADGLTATALLTKGLKAFGHHVVAHVPERLTEGYGLKDTAIKSLAQAGVKLVVTVDNGISGHDAALAANKLGLDLIITDHHRLPPTLPDAFTIINHHLSKDWASSPLAGVGVAFMLLAAVRRFYESEGVFSGPAPSIMNLLALVAIGTIADLVPLIGANRCLVRQGLKFLALSKEPGLLALKNIANLTEGARVSARDVAFRLAPRLNAAGRLGSSRPALDLLLCDDQQQADILAAKLEELNRKRRQEQDSLSVEALEMLEVELSPDCHSIVLAKENWPKGLLGLAASRVLEFTGKPTILFSINEGQAVGSGRSVDRFNLYQALNQLRHLFIAFGGHSQAAGLTLALENLAEFKSSFEKIAADNACFEEEIIYYDCQSQLSQLPVLAAALSNFEPFGPENPAPTVMLPAVKILEAKPTDSKSDRHIKLLLSDGLVRQNVVGFNLASRLHEVSPMMDILLHLEISEFRGQLCPSWKLLDFIPNI